jgi:hypothetical protein
MSHIGYSNSDSRLSPETRKLYGIVSMTPPNLPPPPTSPPPTVSETLKTLKVESLNQLFGNDADFARVNDIAIRHKQEYGILRNAAIETGLIPEPRPRFLK